MNFVKKFENISRIHNSYVCVGLDPDPDKMPISDVLEFNRCIINSTSDMVCAYKPNLAFYEALGLDGMRILYDTVAHIRYVDPDIVIIGDAKRGDVDHTNKMYAKSLFETFDFDAVTVNVWGGYNTLDPFLEYEDKGVFAWCLSSNLDDIQLFTDIHDRFIFEEIISELYEKDKSSGNIGIIAGAPSFFMVLLGKVRSRCPGMPILVPGIGHQEGDLKYTIYTLSEDEFPNILINSSRSILYASDNPNDFDMSARDATRELKRNINKYLTSQ